MKTGSRPNIIIFAALLLLSSAALAQEMPPPHKMPRVPVGRQALNESDKTAIRSREVKGPASIIDGEHLRVGDVDLRLFGVVPPMLSASFGPQARAALDEVSRGQDVECRIRDRDHDSRFLATCVTSNTKQDLALELLKRGLAVTARGSVQPTDLAAPYEAAEQAAETQKIGLWSVAAPQAAVVPATPPAPAPAVAANNPNVPPLPSELKKEEKTSAPAAKTPAAAVVAPVAVPAAAANTSAKSERTTASLPPPVIISGAVEEDSPPGVSGFFARYQLLLTGIVMLLTALGIMLVLAIERRRDRSDEMKAIAAALRGELLAARSVCQARLKNWTDADERSTGWPRIRATLYQAYVGRLGWLGALLARQIASIYGQAADYAAYFSPSGSTMEPRDAISKQQALQMLIQHIEEVLPKLAIVEQTGMRPKGNMARSAAPAQPMIHPVAYEETAVAQQPVAHSASSATHTSAAAVVAPLMDMVRKFTQSRRAPETRPASAEDPGADYTTLIEEEMARMSAEEQQSEPPPNIMKIHRGG